MAYVIDVQKYLLLSPHTNTQGMQQLHVQINISYCGYQRVNTKYAFIYNVFNTRCV